LKEAFHTDEETKIKDIGGFLALKEKGFEGLCVPCAA
jgi:hypothetical protein